MAAPNPERELKRLHGVLKKGPPPVVVVGGTARFFRTEAVDAILAAVPAGRDLRVVDGQQDTDGRELDDLLGGALFGGGTWLVVRRGEAWLKKHGAGLVERLERIAAGCGLVVECTRLDGRTKLAKSLKKLGETFEFRDLYTEPYDRSRSPLEAEIVGWLVARARGAGLRLTDEAAYLLVTTVGKEPAELVAEVERLVAAAGDDLPSRPLGPRDLQGKLSCSFESTPFELAEAVLGFDRARALRSVRAMFERGVRGRDGTTSGGVAPDGVFPFATSWLFSQLAKAHEGRLLLDDGLAPQRVAEQLGVRVFVDRFVDQVVRNPAARLARGLTALLACQRRLRLSGEEPELLLEGFLAEYFAAGEGEARDRRADGGRR